VLARRQAQHGPEHPDVAEAFHDLGRALVGLGAYTEAEAALRRALDLDTRLFGPAHRYVALDRNSLGACLAARGRYAEAEALLLESHAVLAGSYAPTHRSVVLSRTRLVDLYRAWGKPDSVAAWEARMPPG
jgi:tetratricopeptide (TPR) repeat protein